MPTAVAWPVLAILVFVNAINFKGLFKGGVREQRVDCKREEKNVNTVLRIHKCIKDLLWRFVGGFVNAGQRKQKCFQLQS